MDYYFPFHALLVVVSCLYCGNTEQKTKRKPWRSLLNPTEIQRIEASLIVASTTILVILAIPTLQGVVLMNRVPDPNDSETLAKLKIRQITS